MNTVQPQSQPRQPGARLPRIDDATFPNIGDRLTDAGISWNRYSGGWDAAASGNPGELFQSHHQPFNYFANYAPGQPGRAHLQDETTSSPRPVRATCPRCPSSSPTAQTTSTPGTPVRHTARATSWTCCRPSRTARKQGNTVVVMTYDEYGGQWDHVAPPVVDRWGPGTRIPALVISRSLKHDGVDHTTYDTTSIVATIERSYGLEPLGSRDAVVNDLSAAVAAGGR